MTDGRNEARALRVMEILGDFRTLQTHIASHVTRPAATPAAGDQTLAGYALLAQIRTEAQRLLAVRYDAGSLGIQPGRVPANEVQRQALQRIVRDVSGRRFQAHRLYLRASAATRWIQSRTQLLQGQRPNGRHAERLRAIDQTLQQEVAAITDRHVFTSLREADVRKGYWVAEDPTLEQVLAVIQQQR